MDGFGLASFPVPPVSLAMTFLHCVVPNLQGLRLVRFRYRHAT